VYCRCICPNPVHDGDITHAPTSRGSLWWRRPPWLSDEAVAARLSLELAYTWPIIDDSWNQSCSESWIIHSASIHRYRDLNILVMYIASWKVLGNVANSMPLCNSPRQLLVSFIGSFPPQQWLNVKYSTPPINSFELTSFVSGEANVPTSRSLVGRIFGRQELWIASWLHTA
jgi:hypothetical protein